MTEVVFKVWVSGYINTYVVRQINSGAYICDCANNQPVCRHIEHVLDVTHHRPVKPPNINNDNDLYTISVTVVV